MSFAIRMLVTLAILIPYWIVRQPRNTAEIFGIALVAFAAGRIVAFVMADKPNDRE
jgi:hypothetical protein